MGETAVQKHNLSIRRKTQSWRVQSPKTRRIAKELKNRRINRRPRRKNQEMK